MIRLYRPRSKAPVPRRLLRSNSGAALVEFAMILPALLLFILGALEIGYRIYAMSVVNGALREVARMASTGAFTGAQIDQRVTDSIKAFRRTATVTIEKKSYSDFTGVNLPEPITSGSQADGDYCFQDINNNGSWDEDRGVDGLGGPEDVIYYEVSMTYPTLMGFTKNALKLDALNTISENTIVSNEPFAAVNRTPPVTRCVS